MTEYYQFHIHASQLQPQTKLAAIWQSLQQQQIMPIRLTDSSLLFSLSHSSFEVAGQLFESHSRLSAVTELADGRLLLEADPLNYQQAIELFALLEPVSLINTYYLEPLADESAYWVMEYSGDMAISRERVSQLSALLGCELNLLHGPLPQLAEPGVLLMDMDSTAIQIECIDEIAKLAGVGEAVAEVTELAMQGKLDFEQSLRGRVGKLAGAPVSILQQVLERLPLTDGLVQLVSACQQAGWKVGIASGGFTYFAHSLQSQLGLDEAEANQLSINGDRLIGEVDGRVVDAAYKAEMLGRMCEKHQIPRSQAVAIGDGANDLPMLAEAALGVAFHAKPIVAAQAQAAVRRGGLQQVLPLLRCAQPAGE